MTIPFGVVLGATDCAAVGSGLAEAVCTATGPLGLVLIAVYSFLVAVALPFPGEIVLVPAEHMRLDAPLWVTIGAIVLISGLAKAVGSLVAFWIGRGVTQSQPVVRSIRRSRFDVVGWSERQSVRLARRYGYLGLAGFLCIPGFPDTVSIYAFSVLEDDYYRFALAAFAGNVGRLLVTLAVVGGAIAAI